MISKLVNIIPGQNIYNENDITIKLIYPINLIKLIKNGTLIVPPFQRELNYEKINFIKEKIINNTKNNWLLQQGRINLGIIEENIYVLDGQHRIKAIELLINEQKEKKSDIYDKMIEIVLIKFTSIKAMKDYFIDINSNSNIEPIYTYFNNEILKSTILCFKDWLKDNYGLAFRRTNNKNITCHQYNISEYISLFIPDLVKEYYDINELDYGDIDILLDRITLANLITKDKLAELQKNNKRQFYMSDKDYDRCLSTNFYLSYDQILSIDWIFNKIDDIEINNIYKEKTKISSKMRKDIWQKRNGISMIGKCYCCTDNVEYDNFHCGHIESEVSGGKTILSNLEPICMNCNLTMGTQNMKEFKGNLDIFRENLKFVNILSDKLLLE